MSPVSILLMMIVDTVAQVAAKGQWRPYFDILGPNASLYFRPAAPNHSEPTASHSAEMMLATRIIPANPDDEQAQLAILQAMLAYARRHLEAKPEAAA